MEIIDDGHCFACGRHNEAGLRLRFALDTREMRATTDTRVAAHFCGWREAVHGGIITALLDEAMVYACGAAGQYVATASLKVRFRQPVPVRTELRVEGRVTRMRTHMLEARGSLRVGTAVLAEAEGLFVVKRAVQADDPMARLRDGSP